MDLSLTNVITISVSNAQTGVGNYNTSNLCILSTETPASGFGTLGYKIYVEPTEIAKDFGSSSVTYKMATKVFAQQPNILTGGGYLVVIPFESGETFNEAVIRTQGLVQYFGVMSTQIESEQDILDAASTIQSLNKICSFTSSASADFATSNGKFYKVMASGYSKTRCLSYLGTDEQALEMMASYMGRGLSVDFSGSNTTSNMHLKDLIGVVADPSMTQTLLGLAEDAGVDIYPSLQGVAKVFSSGANKFFDQVYNQCWYVGALTVAGFNVLATVNTKIPQTESGMDILKGAFRKVSEQAVSNQYAAPGTWTGSSTFGDQTDFYNNISEVGYYIYSTPISLQSAVDRLARKAALVQIALKEAGGINSANVIVSIEA